jgi:hypothetical protein
MRLYGMQVLEDGIASPLSAQLRQIYIKNCFFYQMMESELAANSK